VRNVIAAILKVTVMALLALALVAVISACGGSSGGSDDAATGRSDQAAEQVEDEHDEDEAAHEDEGDAAHEDEGHRGSGQIETIGDELVVTFRTENMKFEPDTVTVKVGQTVRLRLDNHDAFLHDYTVDEPEFVVLAADGAVHDDHESEAADDDGDEVDPAAQVSLSPLHIAADGNEHAELVFEASEPGEYVFYCSVPGHLEAGMVGKFIIEE
jgi:uncharacterized cupredoxin-like copper-binding protein